MGELAPTVLRRIVLARHLFGQAGDEARSTTETATFSALLRLQDSIEIFLLAAAEHLNARVQRQTTFESYLNIIDEKLEPRALPFRARLIQLNKARANAKHDGLRPDSSELTGFVTVAREFLREAASLVFDKDFSAISLLDQIDDEEIKSQLHEASEAMSTGDYQTVLIASRRALFLAFEKEYDIIGYKDGDDFPNIFARPYSKAPHFSQNQKYVLEQVTEPFDYIVLDHSRLDTELMAVGIDPTVFWNIRRLTPEVYKFPSGSWAHKHDFTKVDHPAIKDHAEYVLEHIFDVIRLWERNKKATRYVHGASMRYIKLNPGQIRLYRFASTEAAFEEVPDDVRLLNTYAGTMGISGSGYFWQVINTSVNGVFLYGYISDEDVDHSTADPDFS